MTTSVRWGSASHQGRVRGHNEDAVLSGPRVFAVADGMGGHAGGGLASALVIAGLAALADLSGSEAPRQALRESLQSINDEIRSRAAIDPALEGMGSTVAGVALITDRRVLVFHLGDSRVYRARDDELTRLTEDHSVVGELIRAGELTEEEARSHPHRSVITRALGVEESIQPEILELELDPDDQFLIASDGLYTEVGTSEISSVLLQPLSHDHRARALIDAALVRGARDNVSAVIVSIEDTAMGATDQGLDDDTVPPAHAGGTSADGASWDDDDTAPPLAGRAAPAASPTVASWPSRSDAGAPRSTR